MTSRCLRAFMLGGKGVRMSILRGSGAAYHDKGDEGENGSGLGNDLRIRCEQCYQPALHNRVGPIDDFGWKVIGAAWSRSNAHGAC